MKTTATVLACAAIAFSLPAAADTWSGAYSATIQSTYSDGRSAKVFVEADHSYSVLLPNGTKLAGTWADANGQSCFTLNGTTTPTCFPAKDYKVGDHFAGEDGSGKFTAVIVEGR